MEAESKHCSSCVYVARDVKERPCCDCENHCNYESIFKSVIEKIEKEMYKLNAEGEFIYSKSEIQIFDKCLEILKGE